MPIRSRIMPRLELVVSVVRESITLADLRDHRESVGGHPDYDPSFNLLFDMRRIVDLDVSPDEIRDHAGFGAPGPRRFGRLAILVADDLAYGMSRIFQAYTNNRYADDAICVVRDAAEAWRWVRDRR